MTQTQNLTTFAETAPQSISAAGHADHMAAMANPYPDPELMKVLTRQYKIADIEWNDAVTDPYSTSLGTVDLMKLLVEIRNISDKLTQFRWIRADIEVEVRMNATPFHIGTVVMSYLPRTEVSTGADSMWVLCNSTVAQKTQNHGVILSASSLNNASMTITREAAAILDPIDEVGNYDGCLGALDFTVLNGLLLATGGSPTAVNIAVFARFVNPRPAGLGYFPLLGSVDVRPQSLTVDGEALSRAAGSIVGPEAKKLFSSALTSGPMEAMSSIVSAIAPAAQFAMSMGLSKPSNHSTSVPAVIDDFRDLNYGHGVNQGTKLALHPQASLGDPQAGFVHKNKIADFIRRPSLVLTRSFSFADLADTALAMIPVHPSLSDYRSDVYTPTPLAYASQSFAYWRGGMKFHFQFISSQFVTARFRITHWPSSAIPSSIEAFAGDAVSMIVDVRGDTPVSITVPYISPYPYQQTRGYLSCYEDDEWVLLPANEQNSFLTVSLVNTLQQPEPSGNALIYMNVYASAAEDFVFGQLTDPELMTPCGQLPAPPPVNVRPQSLEIAFSTPFKSIVPSSSAYEAGVVLPEQYSGIEELCMKYNSVSLTDYVISGLVSYYDLRSGVKGQPEDAIDYWAKCFRWNRGGVRFKLLFSTSVLTDALRYVGLSRARTGSTSTVDYLVMCDTSLRSVLECEIPYPLNAPVNAYYPEIIADTRVNLEPFTYTVAEPEGGTTLAPLAIFRALADDFMFGHQLAMPTYAYTLSPPPPLSRVAPVVKPQAKTPPKLDQSLALPADVREKLKRYLISKESSAGQ